MIRDERRYSDPPFRLTCRWNFGARLGELTMENIAAFDAADDLDNDIVIAEYLNRPGNSGGCFV